MMPSSYPIHADDLVGRALALWEHEVEQRRQFRRRAPSSQNEVFSVGPTGFTVRDLPLSERPRERLTALGAEALSAAELLACILGRGVRGESVLLICQRLLMRFGSLHAIAHASVEELAQIHGVGNVKAVQVKAACELGRRAQDTQHTVGRAVDSVENAVRIARSHLADKKKEHFIVLILDARRRLMRVTTVSVGTLNSSLVHPRETFREVIHTGAAALILAHNHPSGDPTPSPEDLELTQRLIAIGELLGIPVLDHIIVGRDQCISLHTNGFWPKDAHA